jgi:lipopolysaccharide transport system ATP-binding protein
LGSGFHPDMTGRENIVTGGLLSGLRRYEVLAQQEEIIAFAELEGFIDEPIRTYSSGMYLRLAFATAMQFEARLLVIDEVLAVGDVRFQQKCMDRLAAFRAAGKTLILTSHSSDQIRALCDTVLVLDEGRVVMQGDTESGLNCYNDLMRQRTEKRAAQLFGDAPRPNQKVEQGSRQGTYEAVLNAVKFYNTRGQQIDSLPNGESLVVELDYSRTESVSDLALILGIYNDAHVKCFETSLASIAGSLGPIAEHGNLHCYLSDLPLLPGRYYIDIGLYPADWSYVYDYHWQMHPLWIVSDDPPQANDSGVVAVRSRWSATTSSLNLDTYMPSGTARLNDH